jgi:hypothetical protein
MAAHDRRCPNALERSHLECDIAGLHAIKVKGQAESGEICSVEVEAKLIDAVKRRRRAIDQKRCSLPCAEWRVGGPRYP